jgi:hypothetical protein
MFHTGAFYESIDPGGVFQSIAAVREEMFFTSGDDFRVPKALSMLIGEAALLNDASGVRGQFTTPTLRAIANVDVEPIVLAAVFGSPAEGIYHPEAPIPLTPDEALNFFVDSNPAAAAAHYGVFFLSDGPASPVTGNIFSMRCTGAITQVAGAWTNGTLTFGQTLPAGTYGVVGMRARSTDAVAMRLVFPEQVARPGVCVVNAIADQDTYWQRYGRMGLWGQFPSTNPPSLDVLGGTATAQVVTLDLVRLS